MGKRNKKSSKKTNVEMILLATAIIQFIAAIITLTNVIISLNWKYRGGENLPNKRITFFLPIVNIEKERRGTMDIIIIVACIGVMIADVGIIVTILKRWKKGGK